MVLGLVIAQRNNAFKQYHQKFLTAGNKPIINGLQGGCDTISPTFLNDSTVIYLVDNTVGGFATGTNGYGDLAKAQYFDVSSSNDNYLKEVYIYFAAASPSDFSKWVPIDVIEGTGHKVGGVMGTAYLTMDAIVNDVNHNRFSHVVFNAALNLPASKQFYVSVNMKNLHFLPNHDTLAIVSSPFDKGYGAWDEYSDGTWIPFASPNDYGKDLSLYIYPLLSPTPTCTAMPVHLTSLTGQAKENNVVLNWQVTQEVNMKQYNVERAYNNLQFVYAGTVPAVNTNINHTYSYVDQNAAGVAPGNLYYRLKQVNADGNITYSTVTQVPVTGAKFTAKVVNPFHGVVHVNITSPTVQTLQATLYDLQGRKVATLGSNVLGVGYTVITLPTGPLPKGIYILNLSTGSMVYKYKIVNE